MRPSFRQRATAAGRAPGLSQPAAGPPWETPARTGQATQAGPQGTTPADAGGAPAGVDPPGPAGLLGTPPDPAAFSGPAWPGLVAADRCHTPPQLLRWPIVLGLLLLAGWIAATVSLRASPRSLRQPGSSSPVRLGRCPVRPDRRRRPLHGHLPRPTAAVNPERGTHHCHQLHGSGCQACSRRHLLPAARIGLVQSQRRHHWIASTLADGKVISAGPSPTTASPPKTRPFPFPSAPPCQPGSPRSGWSGSDHPPTPWKDSGPRSPASRTTTRFCSALSRRAHKAANHC